MTRVCSILVPMTVLALASVQAGPVSAQEDPHAACAAPPSYVPADLLERTVPLREGVGNSHEAVSTKSAKAQAFYDQGLNYLESYVWIEASRSFHEALRHDADLAMAYLGLSYTYSGLENPAAARTPVRGQLPGADRRGSVLGTVRVEVAPVHPGRCGRGGRRGNAGRRALAPIEARCDRDSGGRRCRTWN